MKKGALEKFKKGSIEKLKKGYKLRINKLASLEATLVWNYDLPTYLLKTASWRTASRLNGTRCDYCFLLASLVDVSRCTSHTRSAAILTESVGGRMREQWRLWKRQMREAANAKVYSFLENIDKKIEKSVSREKGKPEQNQIQVNFPYIEEKKNR